MPTTRQIGVVTFRTIVVALIISMSGVVLCPGQISSLRNIKGRVLDDNGNPVAADDIRVYQSRIERGRRVFHLDTGGAADDSGSFRIEYLDPGRYVLCVNPRHGSTAYGVSCNPEESLAAEGSAVDLVSQSEAYVELRLKPVQTVHVRGLLSNYSVGLNPTVGLSRISPVGYLTGYEATVGPNGQFDFPGVIPGAYILDAGGFVGKQRIGAKLSVNVGSSDVDVSIRLEQAVQIDGAVRLKSKSGGRLQELSYSDYWNIDINLRGLENRAKVWGVNPGTFVFDKILPGSYRIEVLTDAPFRATSAILDGVDVLRSEFGVSQYTTYLEVVLSDAMGAIEGLVVNDNDEPLSSEVVFVPEFGDPEHIRCSKDGRFVADIPIGKYKVYAFSDLNEVEYANRIWMG